MRAIVFPGQGAQYPGMGKSLFDAYPQAQDIFSKIDNALDFRLSNKCFFASEAELKDTSLQQLAILATSLASFEVFKQKNLAIDYLSGLSLGEYTCLYAAEVLSLEDLALLVKMRAYAMQKASEMHPSTMLAVIGLKKDELEGLSKEGSFYLANVNSGQQIVISLKKEDKDKAKSILEARGARVIELEVSGGFHSPFMEPAAKDLSEVVERLEFKDAKIPIVSNCTGTVTGDRERIKESLIKQLTSTVLWKDCIEFMVARGVKVFFEIGPSKVLRGLIRKIAPDAKVVNLEKEEDFESLRRNNEI